MIRKVTPQRDWETEADDDPTNTDSDSSDADADSVEEATPERKSHPGSRVLRPRRNGKTVTSEIAAKDRV
ncbi:hypothetical protein Q5752_000183 [Cryptotrichosporon argae]